MIHVKNLAEYLASYSASIRYEELPPQVVHKVKALLIDTLACGIAGFTSEPARIARRIAEEVTRCTIPAGILGSGRKSTPESATFANGVMIRYLDFNDGYVAGGDRTGGHPSDNFAPVLTCADAVHASGKEVIVASVLAYEAFCRFSDRFAPAPRGFDQSVMGVISSVLGASKILRLTREQTVQAINLAVASNISLGQTREGQLSMWKGGAVANAAKNAVFAAILAKEGMTGPVPIFEGNSGFFKVVSGPIQLDKFGGGEQPFRIMDVLVKRYPCGMVAQTAIDAAVNLRSRISGPDDISAINIGTFHSARNAMAEGIEKWRPHTRESADHSLPYVVAVALLYGTLEPKHFDDEYLHNPFLLELIQKITVAENEDCNKLFPAAVANSVEIVTRTGDRFSAMVRYHRGHPKNPLTDREIEEKFHALTGDLFPPARRKKLLSLIWDLEQIEDIGILMKLLKIHRKLFLP